MFDKGRSINIEKETQDLFAFSGTFKEASQDTKMETSVQAKRLPRQEEDLKWMHRNHSVDFSKMIKRSSLFNLEWKVNYNYDIEPSNLIPKNSRGIPFLAYKAHSGLTKQNTKHIIKNKDIGPDQLGRFYNNDLDKKLKSIKAPSFSKTVPRSPLFAPDPEVKEDPILTPEEEQMLEKVKEKEVLRDQIMRETELRSIFEENMRRAEAI